jgi:hypothetical protein
MILLITSASYHIICYNPIFILNFGTMLRGITMLRLRCELFDYLKYRTAILHLSEVLE